MAILVNGKKVAGIGQPGKSAYQTAVEGGYTGTESEFNQILANAATTDYVDAAKALVVNISGAEGALAADKTNAEIWAAYQAGTPMYAIWNGTVLTPVQVESDWALFGYNLPPTSGSVSISESGGAAEVLGETGQLSALQVSFDPTDFDIKSTNVQDAIEEVNAKIPAKPILRTATLTTSGWSGNSQTVTVNGIVADTNAQLIYVSPANKASATAWGEAGVFCSAQAANSLTFVCDSTPSANISVNISIQEART